MITPSSDQVAPSGEGATVHVGTYNVLIPRDDNPAKAQSSWEHRKASVVETINASFDLVGLQECSTYPPHGQAGYLVEELTGRGWTGYYPWKTKLFADEFHERLPIFWRAELFKLLEAGQLLLSAWTPEELAEVPILEARYASFVKLQTMSGTILWFYTLHLQHFTDHGSAREVELALAKQEEAQRVLAAHIASSVREGETVVVAGDFNALQTSPVLAPLEHMNHYAQRKAHWEHNSFHDWTYPQTSEHIDHVLLAGPGAVCEAAIILSKASDHYPVRATLVL
jgi:endonuclease/exonuclease/phosphatase family metal-dependent hydrolase